MNQTDSRSDSKAIVANYERNARKIMNNRTDEDKREPKYWQTTAKYEVLEKSPGGIVYLSSGHNFWLRHILHFRVSVEEWGAKKPQFPNGPSLKG